MQKFAINTNKQRKAFWEELTKQIPSAELEKALATIDPTDARVLRWHYMDGHRFPQIVTLLNRSISIVRNHHNRGIYYLQEYFQDPDATPVNSYRSCESNGVRNETIS